MATTLLMIFATFCWGLNFPLAQMVVAEVHPLEAASVRFTLAALVLVVMAGYQRQTIPLVRHGFVLGLLALVGVAGFNMLFFLAMQKTSAVNGALIMGTNPLVVALLAAWTLGERPNLRHLIALPFAFVGVAVVVMGGHGASLSLSAGDMLMIGANLAWATYNVMARRYMPVGSPVGNTAAIMIFSAVGLSAAAYLLDTPITMPSTPVGLDIIVISIGGTVMAYLAYNHGIAKLGSGKAALFMNLVPVFAMASSAALGIVPTLIQVLGGCVVIASVIYATRPVAAVAAA